MHDNDHDDDGATVARLEALAVRIEYQQVRAAEIWEAHTARTLADLDRLRDGIKAMHCTLDRIEGRSPAQQTGV